jgi:hypothetical protein
MSGQHARAVKGSAKPAATHALPSRAATPDGVSNQALQRQFHPRDAMPHPRYAIGRADTPAGDTASGVALSGSAASAAPGGQGPGHALDASSLAFMEPRFGRNLGGVRIHTDPTAARAAKMLSADAFAVGADIHFAEGRYRPDTVQGRRLLAHELTHTVQQGGGTGGTGAIAQSSGPMGHPRDPSERIADAVGERIAAGSGAADLLASEGLTALPQVPQRQPSDDDPDDPDHPPQPQPPSTPDGLLLAPLHKQFDPVFETEGMGVFFGTWDPTTFLVPLDTSRADVAYRLYGDDTHVGGFDIVAPGRVRMRSFDGVSDDVMTPMRQAINDQLNQDVRSVIEILCQRIIWGADEQTLLDTTIRWGSRSGITDADNKTFFDRYLDLLASRTLTEIGLFSDTKRTALDWLLIESGEKSPQIYRLIGKASTRPAISARTGDVLPEDTPEQGQLAVGTAVGVFVIRRGEDHIGFSAPQETSNIVVRTQLVDESTPQQAEIALRSSPDRGPRVVIPARNGRSYGYGVKFSGSSFFEEGYEEHEGGAHLLNYHWIYPSTVFIAGGEFQADFPQGGTAEHQQRSEILANALAIGGEALRGLDFDVLSTATSEQRLAILTPLVPERGTPPPEDVSLIARVLYSTPSAEFPRLERTLSTNGLIDRLAQMWSPHGELAVIGRIFTVKALSSMQVPGETLEDLPEFNVGYDEDGFYHYAVTTSGQVASRALSANDFGTTGQVGLGHERAAPGETTTPLDRSALTLQPTIMRGGSVIMTFVRGLRQTLIEDDGPPKGPYLPTQVVRVTTLGEGGGTRVVTALEAAGMLALTESAFMEQTVKPTVRFGMYQLAFLGLARAFGPVLAESLTSGAGIRATAGAVGEAALAQTGRSALLSAAMIASMDAVEQNRPTLDKTPEGRAFLEVFDAAMTIWIAHDVARILESLPRLIAATDRAIGAMRDLSESLLPFRDELEALRRASARWTGLDAEARVLAGGPAEIAVGGEPPQKFLALLREARGEVAAERLIGRLGAAGRATQREASAIFDNLGRLAGADERAATARLAIATRAAQLQPEASDAFLRGVNQLTRSGRSVASLCNFLTAAAGARTPNVFLAEVQKLAARPGVSDEALAVLGGKAAKGANVLDLAWLNRTSISDEALDFLARDDRTPWDLYRRTALDPAAASNMVPFRSAARGAAAEIVAEPEAQRLGSSVRRQVRMGSREIDFELIVKGQKRAFEVKGWRVETWDEALDAAVQRLNKKGLSDAQRDAVRKIDSMVSQLQEAQKTTGRPPFLGITDALYADEARMANLRRVLRANGLQGTQFVPLSEQRIRVVAATTIGQSLGIPLP